MDEKQHKVRIETDGIQGRVIVGESEINYVKGYVLTHNGGGLPTIKITLAGIVPVTFNDGARVQWEAMDGHGIRYIEFEDGSTFGTPSK